MKAKYLIKTLAIAPTFLLAFSSNLLCAEGISSPDDAYMEEHKKYINELNAKFAKRLIFKDSEAYAIVSDFSIACETKEERYLRLMSILLVRLSNQNTENLWVETFIESAQGEARIYDAMHNKNGPLEQPRLIMEINKWGELIPYEIQPEAIMFSCIQGSGPIWEL